jgi:putative addiction module component (TIGR02574 family)
MTEVFARIKSQAEQLSQSERAELAYFLLQSLEPEDAGAAAEWDAEVARRVGEIHGGRASGRPAEQVFAELRERIREASRLPF